MVLSESNFLLYAMHHYQNPQCLSLKEFEADIKAITYVKKLLSRKTEDPATHRLCLNHIITLFNVFGEAARNMLFFRIAREDWGRLATYLLFINQMPERIVEFGISIVDLPLDVSIITELRKL